MITNYQGIKIKSPIFGVIDYGDVKAENLGICVLPTAPWDQDDGDGLEETSAQMAAMARAADAHAHLVRNSAENEDAIRQHLAHQERERRYRKALLCQ